MGSYQFIIIILVIAIIAIGIAGAIAVIRQQGIEHEKRILDDMLFHTGAIIYEHFLLPLSNGGFGKSVKYMQDNQEELSLFLPQYNTTIQEILSTENDFSPKGFHIKIWPNYWQKCAIGVCSKTYNFQRWLLLHCADGHMEIKNSAPVSSDFTIK